MQKRILALLFSVLLVSTMSLAQAPQASGTATGAKVGRKSASIFQRLNLTDDQRTKVQSILQNERSQVQAVRNNTSLTDEQKKQQIHDLRNTDHQQLLAILTPEQQAQLKQLHAERNGRGAAFKAGRGFQALNLTDQQKQQLQPVFQSTRQQMQALRSDTTLTPEQKHEKMKAIRQNEMTQLKSILTPEQQQQLQQMRENRKHRGGEKPETPSGF